MTVSVTVNVPGEVNVLTGTGPVPVVPLPKFHEYDSVVVSSSVDERPSKVQTFCAQETVACATGGLFGGWVTVMLVTVIGVLTCPLPSVARSVTE